MTRKLLPFFAALCLAPPAAQHLGAQAAASGAPAATAAYTITVNAGRIRLLHVEAKLRLADTMLYMVPWGAEHIPDGWRTFVKNERATDANGRAVAMERIAGRKWNVKSPSNSIINLSYDVDVQHDSGNWVPDAREAGYALADRVFIVGRGLFVLPSFNLEKSSVQVVVPSGMKVSAPWDPVTGTANAFVAATRRDLVESTLMVGDFADFTVRTEGFSVAFAVGQEFKSQTSLYEDATRRLLREHVHTFGAPPAWPNMQVIINPNPKVNGGGGGVFRKSISMTFTQAPTLSSIAGWGHTLSHELLHVWNATTLLRGHWDAEWFLEGGGDYFGVLALERAKLISPELYFAKLRVGYQRYRNVAGKMSLTASGEREAEFPQRELLYNGGWVVLMSLDADLRAHSAGATSIDDVMRDMMQRTKSKVMETYTTADILASVNRVSKRDYADFFARYVSGTETLPFGKYLALIGLTVSASGDIAPHAAASAQEKALLAGYLASRANK